MAVYKDEKELMETDWQSKINEATAAGDMAAAAQYEQARNDKIANKNYTGKQTATNNYSQYASSGSSNKNTSQFAGTDYHQDAIDAAIRGDWDAVNRALGARDAKVSTTGNNYGKTSDQIYEELWAKYGDSGVELPAYDSQYSSQIDALLNSILNREEFSYDYTTDPTYLAYEDKYRRLGERAREDTLGDVAGLTGGYASSWAVNAASQAQNDYNQQLSDIIPTLYDAAYNRYMDEYNMDANNLGLVMGVDDMYYGRYRDGVEDTKWQTEFEYGQERDKVADNQWQQSFDWNKTVDEWNMKTTEDSNKFDQMLSKWSLMGVADKEVAEYFGIPEGSTTESYYFNKANLALSQARLAKSGSGSGSGNNNSSETKRASVLEGARKTVLSTGSYVEAARFVLQNTASESDYYSICKELGVSDSAADQVYAEERQAYLDSERGAGDRDTQYYAKKMQQAGDAEAQKAWLMENMYSIPSDIVDDLFKLLDYAEY